MNGIYTIYKRDPDGTQGELIAAITSLELTMSATKLSKIKLEGSTVGTVPLTAGDSVIVYRNGLMLLGFIIDEVLTDCDSPATGLKSWTASGEEDTVMFSWRQVLGDPAELTFDKETYDQIEDSAYNRIIHYIEDCCGKGTTPERKLSDGMKLPGKEDRGTVAVSAYRSINLQKALEEIGSTDELYPKIIRDDKTGAMRVVIQAFRNMVDDVIISPEFGNVLSWSRTETPPEFNVVWVVSGDYSKGRLYVYMEDEESVRLYGRREQIVTKSDIKVYEPDEDEDEDADEAEAEAEAGDQLTEADVYSILQEEARTQLKDHGRKRTWSIEASETHAMAFMDDWQVGDRVTCSIDGERFESQITEAKITYEKGIETVKPSVGDVERGLFGKLFEMIEGLDSRITRKENE